MLAHDVDTSKILLGKIMELMRYHLIRFYSTEEFTGFLTCEKLLFLMVNFIVEIRMTATPGEGAHITFGTELVAKHAPQTYLQWLSNIIMQS